MQKLKIFFYLVLSISFLNAQKKAVVCGAGGFIGHHLVKALKEKNYWVRAVDIKYPDFEKSYADEFLILDLTIASQAQQALQLEKGNFDELYQLAANLGGIAYLTSHDFDIMSQSTLININILNACKQNKIGKIFFSSSSCVYPNIKNCNENCAYPANPELEYGWEKLYDERLFLAFARENNILLRIARFFNVFGPLDAFNNGKEKAVSAICRKVALAKQNDEIEIWGDGNQTRSFIYVDDCVAGILNLMNNESKQSLIVNLGCKKSHSINEIAQMIIKISGKKLKIKHIDGPQGTRLRQCDNTLIKRKINWQAKSKLEFGLRETYTWVKQQLNN